ncbi:MAG: type II toxin-antitoxin system RelE/ParE family toxin [Deltaproteobacteria bacterium]|nr:type II toxin-antitoxin system RelE/ParE family toxin [Deltaproteobacteria bacterium]
MVIWSMPARNDLKQIYDYIAKDSRYYATNVVENVVSKAENLDEFPEIGRVVPEIGDKNVRELIIYSYRLIYELVSNDVQILAIIHGKRDFSSLDRNDLER